MLTDPGAAQRGQYPNAGRYVASLIVLKTGKALFWDKVTHMDACGMQEADL